MASPTANNNNNNSNYNKKDPSSRFVYGKDDALFGSIETRQGNKPFGRVLDAGTGLHSLRWLATLVGDNHHGMTHCVAVTADRTMQRNCQAELNALGVAQHFTLVCGNWFPDATRPDQTDLDALVDEQQQQQPLLFDVILADYLIGAMDGFSPYTQDCVLRKLCRYLKKPGGRLYLVGLQPLPDEVPCDAAASIICRIRQVRDACILLAGHRCYREYPLQWIERQIQSTRTWSHHDDDDDDKGQQQQQQGRLVLLHSSQFPILYSATTAIKQINVGRSKLPIIRRQQEQQTNNSNASNDALVTGLARELDALEEQVLAATANGKRIELGFDYVVTAEWR